MAIIDVFAITIKARYFQRNAGAKK
uniref:Uncharacterized protein n=1 Tax=Arundo donax TaxID=35708 RepID=A0A0A9AZD8_ARUDO